ncbi:hypothetical protein HYFRA_00013916 [Hymenoscyphus fraxineus]|uniref:Uncharacterized protein n=1 Tax=Hymenoscyphus fraxineus TaxID=746836 RepID=A0A9N9L9C0_9HELO|nr:hypothetical protein HYFRA_00013916 [Hymenoscyphus fraxineus]
MNARVLVGGHKAEALTALLGVSVRLRLLALLQNPSIPFANLGREPKHSARSPRSGSTRGPPAGASSPRKYVIISQGSAIFPKGPKDPLHTHKLPDTKSINHVVPLMKRSYPITPLVSLMKRPYPTTPDFSSSFESISSSKAAVYTDDEELVLCRRLSNTLDTQTNTIRIISPAKLVPELEKSLYEDLVGKRLNALTALISAHLLQIVALLFHGPIESDLFQGRYNTAVSRGPLAGMKTMFGIDITEGYGENALISINLGRSYLSEAFPVVPPSAIWAFQAGHFLVRASPRSTSSWGVLIYEEPHKSYLSRLWVHAPKRTFSFWETFGSLSSAYLQVLVEYL